jgi:hypothetical protein
MSSGIAEVEILNKLKRRLLCDNTITIPACFQALQAWIQVLKLLRPALEARLPLDKPQQEPSPSLMMLETYMPDAVGLRLIIYGFGTVMMEV